MTIYDKATLQNIFIKSQSAQAFAAGYIDRESYNRIKAEHPSDLYSPNTFVAIGLGLLTLLIVFATMGLFFLVTSGFHFGSAAFLMMGIACYIGLEIMCSTKKHKNSGVDTVLMLATASFMGFGFSIMLSSNQSDLLLSLILLIISLWFGYRFVNVIGGAVACICLLIFIFNLYNSLGEFTIFSFPFVLMAVSAIIYFASKKQTSCTKYLMHYRVYNAIKIVAVFAFYLFGNYYVVDSMIHENYLLNEQSALSAKWFFWGWTFAIPILYTLAGLVRKDLLLVRAGVLLIVASILTFRNYYKIISPEAAMIVAGLIFIPVSYFLMRFLDRGKYGFLYNPNVAAKSKYADAEPFALSQVLAQQPAPVQETNFGGGSFGGAGSGSSY